MSSVNPVFQSLSFGQDQEHTSQQYVNPQPVYNNRQCGFNCICCARMQLGNYCSCAFPKQNSSTQTEDFQTLSLSMTKENLWTRGTPEHSTLQKMISATIDKYQLGSAKDRFFPAAVGEIRNYLKSSSTLDVVDDKKISDRIKKAIHWRKYYSKKRSYAVDHGMSVRQFLKRKKTADKENLLPSQEDTINDDLQDVGIDNRGFEQNSDSDSDNDIPLSALAAKKK